MAIEHNLFPYFTEYADQPVDASSDPAAVEDAADGGVDDATENQDGDVEIVIPEDLSTLDDQALADLMASAKEAFGSLYGENGVHLTDEGLEALSVLTSGIKRLQADADQRAQASQMRTEQATALAEEAGITFGSEDETKVEPEPEPTETLAAEEPEAEPVTEPEGPREIRVNLAGLTSKGRTPTIVSERAAEAVEGQALSQKDLLHAGSDLPGFSSGTGINVDELAGGLDRSLASLNVGQWQSAMEQGRPMRQQQSLAVLRKPFTEDMILRNEDPKSSMEMVRHAVDESRLEGGSLVAAGGWCAPSEVIYDLFEVESRDGLFSMPEINVARGGINITPGPDFATIYAGAALGFEYTEAQDIAGTYAVDGSGIGTGSAGTKPCFHVACPSFTETRLGFDGLCLTAGLLQQRGYPEVVARTVRGALVAHDHRIAGRVLSKISAASTAVAITAAQVGATAPILTSVEIQVEHYRTVSRISRSVSLEAIFPFWVRGAIRADLSRRQGVDMLDVSDAMIEAWFRNRGVNPQFVYNYNDLTGAASAALGFPTSVKFLLYAAGTFIKGAADIITLDTIYDSVNLGKNDFTALFTEEGYLVAKAGHDSREVTVPICVDGATHGGVSIGCLGEQSGTAQI